MHDNFHTFYFNGHFLYELGAVIAQPPTHITSMRDINFESIPGRSGDSIIDNGRYENKTLQFPIRAVPAFCDLPLQDFKYKLAEWLQAGDCDYKEYRDTYNPGYFRKGIVTEISEVVAVERDVYETAITFNFEPFLYSDSGLQSVTFNSNSNFRIENAVFRNPEKWESEPIIEIIPSSSATMSLKINDVSVAVYDTDKTIIIDVPNRNVYDVNGEPCNDLIEAPELPVLLPGNNEITASGTGDYAVKIIPNWRRL